MHHILNCELKYDDGSMLLSHLFTRSRSNANNPIYLQFQGASAHVTKPSNGLYFQISSDVYLVYVM
ncbi:hypothetical protein Lalb_Chr20g0113751 [Lupinus albus]|uniref:Uncharacterized protein n=1 Tax=Lupinus albus TaxID=3870 RepID=A0A6A4NQ21_LUPAL|nr:hypothetical protein Lalb_Chr20g0113751 [Lupinus albus]